jgi:hypothetical protein
MAKCPENEASGRVEPPLLWTKKNGLLIGEKSVFIAFSLFICIGFLCPVK